MVAVIGDVHGCYYTLQQLVDKIKIKHPNIKIYCVGDLVDRGNYNLEVIEYLLSENIEFTLGNHDLMFYSYYKQPDSIMAKNWIQNGSATTITSYYNNNLILEKHLSIVINAPLFIDTEDCFISHAGISKSYKNRLPHNFLFNLAELKKFLESDLSENNSIIWCRGELLNIDKLQVVGHTHRKETYFNPNSNVMYIDTTAFGKNKLTAVIVNQNKLVEIIDQKTFGDDSDNRWNCYL